MPGAGDVRRAIRVGKAQHSVGIGDIEIVADQRHAEWRIQSLEKHACGDRPRRRRQLSRSSVMRLALGAPSTGPCHHQPHQPALDALGIIRLGRGIGFGHQNITIRKHIKPARVLQAAGKGGHAGSWGSLWLGAGWPASGWRNIHRWYHGWLWCRQARPRAGTGETGSVAISPQAEITKASVMQYQCAGEPAHRGFPTLAGDAKDWVVPPQAGQTEVRRRP